MSKLEIIGITIILCTTIQFALLSVMIGENHKVVDKKLNTIIEQLKQNK